MTDDELTSLIQADDLGLLTVKPKRTAQSSEEERLAAGFSEVLKFVEGKGEPPTAQGETINERILYSRLEAIRRNPQHRAQLEPFDSFGLLKIAPQEETPPDSIDDILNDPLLTQLEPEAGDIFNLKHLPAKPTPESPDYVAQRKPCKEFENFEPLILQCQADLKSGRRKMLKFAYEQQIEAGKFYVLHGVLLTVVSIGAYIIKNGKKNARLRCIFENGTESDMLLRSLSVELYKDGYRVTERDDDLIKKMVVNEDDKNTGFIYVLRSLSEHPDIKSIPNLYKIGLARTSIEGRIKNAANEPTYLMAPVVQVLSFQCFNVDLPKMENLLHRFFDAATVQVQVKDLKGNYSTPKEWFSVPLTAIEEAVRLLISGEIVKYMYDAQNGRVVVRTAKRP